MNVRDYFRVIWRRRWLVALMIGIGVGAVYLVGQPSAPSDVTYSASATLAVTDREPTDGVLLYSFVAEETPEIAELVAAEVGPDAFDDEVTVDAIIQRVTVIPVPEIGTLAIDAIAMPDESTAILVVDAYPRFLTEYAIERRTSERDEDLVGLESRKATLERTITQLQASLDRLEAQQTEEDRLLGRPLDRIQETQLASALNSLATVLTEIDNMSSLTTGALTPLRVVGPPAATPEQVQVDPIGFRGRMVIGVALATALGLGLALALHRFDSRIFSRRDAETAFRLPVLSEIPRISWRQRRRDVITVTTDPSSGSSEAFRLLRSNISMLGARLLEERPSKYSNGIVILTVAPGAGVGKTVTSANLAAAVADASRSVLLISADLRQPKSTELLGVREVPGLTDLIDDYHDRQIPIDLDRAIQPSRIPGVDVLPHGSHVQNPGETLALSESVLRAARERYDVIVIDTAPMLVGNDVNELVGFVDLVLVVARSGKTTIDEGEWADETLERLQAPVIGVALVGATSDLKRRGASRRGLGRLRRQPKTSVARIDSAPTDEQTAGSSGNAPVDGQTSLDFTATPDSGADDPNSLLASNGAPEDDDPGTAEMDDEIEAEGDTTNADDPSADAEPVATSESDEDDETGVDDDNVIAMQVDDAAVARKPYFASGEEEAGDEDDAEAEITGQVKAHG